MVRRIWLAVLIGFVFNQPALAENRYSEEVAPPSVGWESALKFFTRGPASNSVATSPGSGAPGDSAFFLDQNFFVNSKYLSDGVERPKFGFNGGYEWDQSWYGTGIYLNYVAFNKMAEKFSVTTGFYYPRIESGFPLYVRANVGLGYYNTDDEDQKGATVDYNAGLGIRFFTSSNWVFNLELGSRNHTRLLKSASAQSIIVGSGLAITF